MSEKKNKNSFRTAMDITTIKTQEQLNALMKWEEGKYYLVLGGVLQIPSEIKPWVDLIEGQEYINEYFKQLPGVFKTMEIKGKSDEEIEDMYWQLFQIYLVPWRYH